jgi:hypothetical protein
MAFNLDNVEKESVRWNKAEEEMVANWCDQSKCFNWMNTEAFSRYSIRAIVMSITTNTIISLSGVANLFLGGGLISIDQSKISLIFGCVSISVGIVNMIQDKLNWNVLANNFKQSAGKWGIITQKIEEILAIPRSHRGDCGAFLKYIKQDINEASDTNSIIPKDIREMCNEKFGHIKDFDVPDICGQVEHTIFYKNMFNQDSSTPLIK